MRKWTIASFFVLWLGSVCASADRRVETTQPSPGGPTTRRVQWYRHAILDTYQNSTTRNPKWDEPAKQALSAAVRSWSAAPDDDGDEDEEIWYSVHRADQLGCDDPMVLYIAARNQAFLEPPDAKALSDVHSRAAELMQSSTYPAIFKCRALLWAAKYSYELAPQPIKPDESAQKKLVDAAIALMPAIGADTDMPVQELIGLFDRLGELSVLVELDRAVYFERAYQQLQKVIKDRSLLLTLEGEFQVSSAWDARGTGLANTVTPEGAKLFSERLVKAKSLLEQAWQLDQTNSIAAQERIVVSMGLGEQRDVMEQWYARAISADPDNYSARESKLNYLLPRWLGDEQVAIEFGRECLQTKRFDTEIPLVLVHAWDWISFDGLTAERVAKPEVWADMKQVYEGYVTAHSHSRYWRSRYAQYAELGGHWTDADPQFKALGRDYSSLVFTQSAFSAGKKEAAEKAINPPGGTRPEPVPVSIEIKTDMGHAKHAYSEQVAAARTKLTTAYNAAIDAANQRGDKNEASALQRECGLIAGSGIAPKVEDGWTIMFQSADPLLFNIAVANADSYSIPIAFSPSHTKYLRLRRMDTQDYVVIAISENQVLANGSIKATFWWRGDKRIDASSCNFGIVDQSAAERSNVILAMEPEGNFSGWGFGRTVAGDRQGYVWHRVEISPTAFEISLTSRELKADEQRHLLK